VAIRLGATLRPASMKAASRSRASCRLRSWVRKRCALITSTPSLVTRRSRRASKRSRTGSGSEGELAMSKRSSTAVATLLTFCPPGPAERTKRSVSSDSGMSMAGVVTGSSAGDAGKQCHRLREFAVEGCLDAHRLPGLRVLEAQRPRMQQHAMHADHPECPVVPPVAVAGVADQVVRGVLEVAADLAEAAGLRLRFQQGVARAGESAGRPIALAPRQHPEAGHGRLLLRFAGTAIKRMVDGERVFRGPATADRPVALVH